jgi:hypothetical protein
MLVNGRGDCQNIDNIADVPDEMGSQFRHWTARVSSSLHRVPSTAHQEILSARLRAHADEIALQQT